MKALPMLAPLGSQLCVLCLVIWVTVCMSLQLRDKDSGFISNKFVAHPGKRLAVPTISQAEDNNQSRWCHSVNVRLTATKSGRHVCELISTDRYNHSEYLVEDKDLVHFGIKSPCEESPCSNGECVTVYDEPYFYCACSSGYTGLTCSADIDECRLDISRCGVNAYCTNTVGSYFCTCNSGYYWIGGRCAVNQVWLSHGFYGRVEVYHNGQWGTVCDDYWTINDGRVVCRSLGYGSVVSVHQAAHYGQGSGPIWLDDVHCSGNEATLFSCQFTHTHNCGHSEDASVVCS
ncbi:lysyl oxidase homolog 3A isoform X2 [Nematostella vectensis]|uniref:lysyl oxidase homolog 3A isoform X2 n=1 Tax=Nematostella vectensis TaxID=45351 RepID=UPI0020771349|nr:lysyl oxidase homolog 3A isoform X2 [Nematostella vectensis]